MFVSHRGIFVSLLSLCCHFGDILCCLFVSLWYFSVFLGYFYVSIVFSVSVVVLYLVLALFLIVVCHCLFMVPLSLCSLFVSQLGPSVSHGCT